MIIEVRLPAMGEGIIDATISRWLVKQSDFVTKDTPLVEISTDKVDSEIVAPSDGYVQKMLISEGELAKVGELLAILSTQQNEFFEVSGSKPVNTNIDLEFKVKNIDTNKPVTVKIISERYISPFIRTIAMQHNISAGELETISGSGIDKRITKYDIVEFLVSKSPDYKLDTSFPKPTVVKSDNNLKDVEYQELSRVRKMIGANMLLSKHTAPHVSSFVEVNVTKLVSWRNKVKTDFDNHYNENLTFFPLFIEAVVKALQNFPRINASLEGDYIAIKKNINIGIATALPDGNLIVPVISNAHTLNLPTLVKQLNSLSHKARESSLLPSEIQGGTFTITNVGSVGNTGGTPIIRQPELAILAIGSINKKPVAVKTGQQYGIAVADVVELWLSYDHRIIDGALGGAFLKQIAEYLQDFDDTRTV